MGGKTHRVGGMLCVLTGYYMLESKGMLIKDVSPLLQMTVMYPFAIYGSIFPDLDHHEGSIPSKDIVSVAVNKCLHVGKYLGVDKKSNLGRLLIAKHRSWQTHSDLFLVICLALMFSFVGDGIHSANDVILKLVFTGFILGVISHMILDMLTPEGIWCLLFKNINKVVKIGLPEKISLVPKSHFFATSGPWEVIVRKIMWVLCIVMFTVVVYRSIPYHFVLNL